MLLGNILFFMMLFAPRAWQVFKMPLVAVAAVLLAAYYVRKAGTTLNRSTVAWFALLLSYGFIWSLIGVYHSNPGVYDFFRLNVVWVLLYALFVFYVDTTDKFIVLAKTMVWAAIAVSAYDISVVLSAFDVLPNVNTYLRIDDIYTSAIGIYEGFIQLTAHNVGTLTFLAPFLVSACVMKSDVELGVSRNILLAATILSIVAVLISGRRALWLEMLIVPFLLAAFNWILRGGRAKGVLKKTLLGYAAAVALLAVVGHVLTTYAGWNFAAMSGHFTQAFAAEDVRAEQGVALWNGFKGSPVFGTGFGVGVPEVIRNEQSPWIYELSYLLILYNTGILGTLMYALCLGFVYYYGYYIVKMNLCGNSVILPLLVGFTCFLIANATNPYFSSYDFMWVLFLPVCYINIILNRQHD
jgi:hypothetical protein